MEVAKQKVAKRYHALGTVIDLAAFGTATEQDLDEAFALIAHYEDLLTVNREHSDLMAVNQAAALRAVTVADPVYQLSKIAVQQSQQHFGFNAAIGPLVKLWHIGFADARLPEPEEIAARLRLTNPDKILFKDDEFSIFLPEPGMEIDLGGIAKGYIADRVQDLWRAKGISAGIINLGGNLILLGAAPHQPDRRWRVGIRNPLDASDTASIVTLATGASSVVTSGIAERRLELNGRSYHHIIDPETGWPHDNNIASVTVLSKYSLDGEIETTRLFFADQPLPSWLARPDLYGAIFVYRDKSIELVGLTPEQVTISNPEFYFKK